MTIYLTPNSDPTMQATTAIANRLLAVDEQKRSGLILCNPHSAEFAGPGAAICNPFQIGYTQIIAIGAPEIVEVSNYDDRQKAYSRRIQWVRWLHKIALEPIATQRAENLFAGFEEFFGSEILTELPPEVLALLAGVLPHTIQFLRSQRLEQERSQGQLGAAVRQSLNVRVIELGDIVAPLNPDSFVTLLTRHTHSDFYPLPCSA